MIIRFDGIDNPEDAGFLTNQIIYNRADQLPDLDDGVYYQYQLVGMNVVDDNGKELGKVIEIIETGANDVYVILNEQNGREILIPAIKSVIKKIDLKSNLMVVKLQEWMD